MIRALIAIALLAGQCLAQKGIAFAYDANEPLIKQALQADAVVINPDSGPGRDGWYGWREWRGIVNKIDARGAATCYYIDADQKPGDAGYPEGKQEYKKSGEQMGLELSRYIDRLPARRPWLFIDDAGDAPTSAIRALCAQARKNGIAKIIANPGNPRASADWLQIADYVVTWETKNYPVKFASTIPPARQIHVAVRWKGSPELFVRAARGRCAFAAAFAKSDEWQDGGSCYTARDPMAVQTLKLLK